MGSTPTPPPEGQPYEEDVDPVGAQIEVLDASAYRIRSRDPLIVGDNLLEVSPINKLYFLGFTDDEPSTTTSMDWRPGVAECCLTAPVISRGTWEYVNPTDNDNANFTFRDVGNSGIFEEAPFVCSIGNVEYNNTNLRRIYSRNEDVYRQRRFTKGWEEVKKKVGTMNGRIGTKTSGHAVFENVIYFMDVNNKAGVNPGQNEDNDSDSENSRANSEISVAEGDHRYAAVILTQKESSPTIRDHQYQSSFSSSVGSSNSVSSQTHESFILRRYKRERQLVRYLNSVFGKKNMLEETTGAKISLEVSYEHYVFNSKNYITADEMLSNSRKKIFRVPVVATADLSTANSPSDMFANYNPNNPQIFMKVERVPAIGNITPGVQIQYARSNTSKSNTATPIVEPPPTTTLKVTPQNDLQSSSRSAQVSPEILDLDHSYGLLPLISFGQNTDIRNSVIQTSPSTTDNNLSQCNDAAIMEDTIAFDSAIVTNYSLDQEQEEQPLKNASTITEPICGLCGAFEAANCSSDATEEMWLRCFNALCHFMAHPQCLGFRVNSAKELAMLPPYLCSHHR